VCWIKPNNIVVNQLFGVNYGLAMGMVTFGEWAFLFSSSFLPPFFFARLPSFPFPRLFLSLRSNAD
jgi:hypothetical protein